MPLPTKFIKAASVSVALLLSACVAPTDTPVATAPTAAVAPAVSAPEPPAQSNPVVTANFLGGGGSWSTMGGIKYRYTVIERDGEVHICGAFTARGPSNIRALSRQVLRKASAQANGELIMTSMSFFREVSNSNWSTHLVGVPTSCRSTGKSVETTPLDSVRVGTQSGRYRS